MSIRKTKPADASFQLKQVLELPLPLPFNEAQLKDYSRSAPSSKSTDLPKGVTKRPDGGFRVRISNRKSKRLVEESYPATTLGFFMACEVARVSYLLLDEIKGVQMDALQDFQEGLGG